MSTAQHLSKRYGRTTAVDDVSFECLPGTVTGFLGPNGAGKSTTLRMLTALTPPSSGVATVGGRPYRDLPNPGRVAGVMLDAAAAHAGRTGRETLLVAGQVLGASAKAADDMLERVGLAQSAGRRVGQYSLGMRQRLGIAVALLGDPAALILDEPANGLDPEGIRWMRELLKGLADQGRTILVSSHLLSEMELLADDLVIVAAGKLVRQGTVQEILNSMSTGTIRVLTPQREELVAALGPAATVNRLEDGGLVISGVDAPTVGKAALQAGAEIH